MSTDSLNYLSNYIKVTEYINKTISKHMKRFNINNEICAWYADWEDFCFDWCDNIGYTRTDARKLLHGGKGEFKILPDYKGIIRFAF